MGVKQAELIRKGEEITQRLMKKYKSIILLRDNKKTTDKDNAVRKV